MFKKKDIVYPARNPLDEQLGEVLEGVFTVEDIKGTRHLKGTSGQWVKLEGIDGWFDSSYFKTTKAN